MCRSHKERDIYVLSPSPVGRNPWDFPKEVLVSAFFNHYSFPIIAIGLALAAGLILLTNKPKWNDYLAFGVIIASLIAAWVILHPRETPLMNDAKKVKEMIGTGTPVLLEFQSPYCIACTQAKPAVDKLEEELGNRIHIIRLNIQDQVAQELAPVYHFEFTPTFIYFDAQGNELWRTIGNFDAQKVRDSLQ